MAPLVRARADSALRVDCVMAQPQRAETVSPEATALLRTIRFGGPKLAKDLSTALGAKDAADYGACSSPPPP
jgi:hypothetical protein